MATREQLQRKIFSRWCNQKLSLSRDIQVNDVVTEIGDGVLLINLLEVLSETTFPGKFQKNPKMRVHKIDNLNNALKFVWDSGVQMKVKPSAEGKLQFNIIIIILYFLVFLIIFYFKQIWLMVMKKELLV